MKIKSSFKTLVLIPGLLLIFSFSAFLNAGEILCYSQKVDNASSFGIYTGWDSPNNPIVWTHNVPPGILGKVVRVGLYIEAYDVDYPANDEHDRVYFNGYDLGLLEGFNNSWVTVEKTIPVSAIKEGDNPVKVSVDELHKKWKVTIRSSELRFYCSSEEPDFSIGVTPSYVKIKQGETASYNITLTSLNGFNSSVSLSVKGLPAGASENFTNNPVTPTANSVLNVTTSSSVNPGKYELTIVGEGGGKENSVKVELEIEPSSCPDFKVKINAEPEQGNSPLEVKFSSEIDGNNDDYRYLWNFGDGESSTEKNPSHIFRKAGTYKVKLDVENSCGNNVTDTKVIKVYSFNGTISKKFSREEVMPGEELTMKLIIHNLESVEFKNIKIWDKLSKNLKYLGDDSPVKPQWKGDVIEWDFPEIRGKQTIVINVKLRVKENAKEGKITNIAYLTNDSINYNIESNHAVLKIISYKIRIRKSVNLSNASPGDELNYTLKIVNNNKISIKGIEISDNLSDKLEFLSQKSAFDFTRDGKRLVWKGDLKEKREYYIKLKARIKDNAFSGENIINKAKLETNLKTYNSNTVSTKINATPIVKSKIVFRKRAEIPQVDVGKIIRFKITIRNSSSSALISPVIDDYLPQGFSYVNSTTVLNGFRYNDPNGRRHIRWKIPDIRAGEETVLRYQVIIGADARRGKNINRAVLSCVDNSRQNIRLEARAFVNVSSSNFVFYSGVEGFVYLDRDNDNELSGADTLLEGIEVRLSTGESTTTDKTGHFRFEGLYPGEYAIGVNKATLSENYTIKSQTPLIVVLSDGLTSYVEFRAGFEKEEEVGSSSIEGMVFFDKNQNKTYDEDEPVLKEYTSILDNKIIAKSKSGKFLFSHLKTGKHKLKIRYNGKEKEFNVSLNKGKNMLKLPLKFSGITVIIEGKK